MMSGEVLRIDSIYLRPLICCSKCDFIPVTHDRFLIDRNTNSAHAARAVFVLWRYCPQATVSTTQNSSALKYSQYYLFLVRDHERYHIRSQ
jgi:hypothetical protein